MTAGPTAPPPKARAGCTPCRSRSSCSLPLPPPPPPHTHTSLLQLCVPVHCALAACGLHLVVCPSLHRVAAVCLEALYAWVTPQRAAEGCGPCRQHHAISAPAGEEGLLLQKTVWLVPQLLQLLCLSCWTTGTVLIPYQPSNGRYAGAGSRALGVTSTTHSMASQRVACYCCLQLHVQQ